MVWDTWIVDGLVNLAARIVWVLSYPVRMLQTGRVSRYALLICWACWFSWAITCMSSRRHVAQRIACS